MKNNKSLLAKVLAGAMIIKSKFMSLGKLLMKKPIEIPISAMQGVNDNGKFFYSSSLTPAQQRAIYERALRVRSELQANREKIRIAQEIQNKILARAQSRQEADDITTQLNIRREQAAQRQNFPSSESALSKGYDFDSVSDTWLMVSEPLDSGFRYDGRNVFGA